ncbi:dipicolinate synthase subunit DpsA [Porcipelethomonas sp.]|uniref:dipicolinate synthase subunit DpsA n=1 Tax=Porcipelethomonas sp. TaxID=2981675 RepID=UPI003EF1921D
MNKDITFLVAGGDLRQVYTAKKLAENYKVYAAGFDNNIIDFGNAIYTDYKMQLPELVDYIVLPLPASINGVFINAPFCRNNIPISALAPLLKNGGTVFGGKIDPSTMKIFSKCGIDTVDYFEREELNILNAVPTAEGAVQIAMEEMATTIYGQKVLVTGFGRIAKVLVKILKGLGADVTITARKYSDLSWAEIYGCKAVHTSVLDDAISGYDLIFNTVPAVILDEKRLERIKSNTLVIDLASKPGGVDFDTAGRLGVKVVWALSLPGKVAPVTSGEIIACTILNILKERRYTDE